MTSWLPPTWRGSVVEHGGVVLLAVARPGDEPLMLKVSIDPLGLRSQWASLCARAWMAPREAEARAAVASREEGT